MVANTHTLRGLGGGTPRADIPSGLRLCFVFAFPIVNIPQPIIINSNFLKGTFAYDVTIVFAELQFWENTFEVDSLDTMQIVWNILFNL